MPKRRRPKPCACRCGDMTKGGDFIPGHDAKVMSAINDKVGGTIALRDLVEKTLNCRIKPRWD